jgi:pimeloyl-ACP methyl ester carboxylesterase
VSAVFLAALLALPVVLALWTALLTARVNRQVPACGSLVDFKLGRLHFVDTGPVSDPSAPVLVMVHGLGGQLRHFTYDLAGRLRNSYRVIAVDRPGSGHSGPLRGASKGLEAQADLIAELIDHLNIDQVVLVGHSLGGAICLSIAQRHRSRVAALALIAPLTTRPPELTRGLCSLLRLGQPLIALCAWTLVMPIGRLGRGAMLTPIFSPDSVPADYSERGGGDLTLRPAHFLAAAQDMAAIPAFLAHIDINLDQLGQGESLPLGILFGRDDQVLSPELHGVAFAHKLSWVHLDLVEGGHMLPLTDAQQCEAFIRQCVGRAFPRR